MMNPRIIFMGTRGLAEKVLARLIASKIYKPVLVISQPDKPIGRKQIVEPVPVKTLAQAHTISVWQPATLKNSDVIKRIQSERPDCIIVASYGKLIPQSVIVIPPHGILNVHASLLPRYRGASPIQRSILAGDAMTGTTIMSIDQNLDTGNIVAQQICAIAPDETAETLSRKLADAGSALLLKTLPDWLAGKIMPKPQDNAHATFAPLFTKADGLVAARQSAEEIERMVRALSPWPGTYILLKNGKKCALRKTRIVSCMHGKRDIFSFFLTDERKCALHTVQGCLILEEVQPEGKKPMSGYAFFLGNKNNL